MIAVFSGERSWRTAIEQAIKANGVPVRTASRPAELAKSLTDGAVRIVVIGPHAGDLAASEKAVTSQMVIRTSPGETTESVVRRAMELLQAI
jgi:hypothetical protein